MDDLDWAEALADQARQYEDAFNWMDPDLYRLVLQILLDRKMPMEDILLRITYAEEAGMLFREFMRHVKDGPYWKAFQKALPTLPAEFWEAHDELLKFRPTAPDTQMLIAMVIKKHPQLVAHPEGTLFMRSGPVVDAYWTYRVQHYTRKRDHKRAFEELKRANNGLLLEELDRTEQPPSATFFRYGRVWRASKDVVGELAMEIHTAMVAAGLLTELQPGDCEYESSSVTRTVYRMKATPPYERLQNIERVAWDFAMRFLIARIPQLRQASGGYRFAPPGAAILQIADHFRAKKEAKKRAKYEAALASWNATHTNH